MVVPGTISRAFCLTFGALYPSYASFKALKSNQRQRLAPWLMYWTIFGLFCSIEFFADHLIFWVPFYQELKMILILWFVLPQTQGSLVLYQYLVHPYLCIHEREIDDRMISAGNAAQQMGAEFGRRGLQWLQQAIVNLIHSGNRYLSQHHPQAHRWIKEHTLDAQRAGVIRPGLTVLRGATVEASSEYEDNIEEISTQNDQKPSTAKRIGSFFKSSVQMSGKKGDSISQTEPNTGSSVASFEELVMVNSGLTTSDSPMPISKSDMFGSSPKQTGQEIIKDQINQLERMMQHLKTISSEGKDSEQVRNLIHDTGSLLAKLKSGDKSSEQDAKEKEKTGGFHLFGQIRNRGKSSK